MKAKKSRKWNNGEKVILWLGICLIFGGDVGVIVGFSYLFWKYILDPILEKTSKL